MNQTFSERIGKELAEIETAGLFKKERIITTPQGADIKTSEGKEVINFCANKNIVSADPKYDLHFFIIKCTDFNA